VLLAAACKPAASAAPSAETKTATLQAPAGTERPAELVVGVTPFLPPDAMEREFDSLVRYLGEAVGLPARLRVAESYADISKLIGSFDVHVAQLGPLAYVEAKREHPELVLLAKQIALGSSTYSAYVVTRSNGGVADIDDLRGRRFAFVDRRSASGYLYPLAFFRKRGIEPETFFASTLFAGNHERVVEMVLAGEVDAGATYSGAVAMARGRLSGGGLKIVEKAGRIPYYAYCASGRLDADLAVRIRDALLAVSTRTPEGRRVLGGVTSINGFAPASDAQYDDVRRVAQWLKETPLPGAPRAMQ
jgi:phosphonate transport system substrate-binding protein